MLRSSRDDEKGGARAPMLRKLLLAATGGEHVPESLPFPDRLKCILTYSEMITLVNNSSATGVYQFCGNDLFDPNFTGTGGQPMWFDQLSALYLRYRVYGSACSVRIMCPTTTNTTFARVTLAPVAATAASLSYDDVQSQPRSHFSTLNVTGGPSSVRLNGAATTAEIVGCKDVEGADRLQAQVSASPSERWLWALAGQSYDPGVTAVTLTADVRISYYCEFFDRKLVTQSLNAPSFERIELKTQPKVEAQTPVFRFTNQSQSRLSLQPGKL